MIKSKDKEGRENTLAELKESIKDLWSFANSADYKDMDRMKKEVLDASKKLDKFVLEYIAKKK